MYLLSNIYIHTRLYVGSRLGAGACSQRSSCRSSCTAGSPAAEATGSRGSSSQEPARADADDAAPARHMGRTQSRPQLSAATNANTNRWQRGERASSG